MVVAATHLTLRERVALKFLHPELGARTDLVTRFIREAQAVVRIKSEHVARVMDVGQLPGGTPYMVMEYLQGTDFSRLLRQRGPLPVGEVVDAILQVCSALAEAHTLGIVHRDLKPGNLFLTTKTDGSPMVKVLDFGISKLGQPAEQRAQMAEDDQPTLTTGEDVLGSPLYMSPEQIKTPRDVDGRADIWSLGAIVYRLLTGKSAFQAENPAAILARIVSEEPKPLRELRPDVDPGLEAVVRKCLHRDVNARFQTVHELAAALLPFAPATPAASLWQAITSTSFPRVAVPEGLRASVRPSPGESTQGAWQITATPRTRGRIVIVVGGLVAVAAGVLAVVFAPRGGPAQALGRSRLPEGPALVAPPPPPPPTTAEPSAPPALSVEALPTAKPKVHAPRAPKVDPLDGRL